MSSLVFTPGCNWRIDRRVLFVEYETVTGKPESKRFDLSAETEYLADGYKMLSFDEISKPEAKLQYSIQKIVYFEKECSSMVAFSRGCRQTRLFIPTKVYFDTKAKKTAEEMHNKLLRNIANSAYGMASRDWTDVLADSARYIHMQQSRCNGKTLWLSSATSFADKQPLWNVSRYHDICERWLKEPPEPCEKGVPNTKLIDPTTLYFQDTTTGEMKPYEGIKNLTPNPMHFRGKTWTHPESSYGKKGHMLIVDINSKTFIPDDDYLDVEVGDVMWYDDGNDGKNEPEDHGKLFVWQGLGVGWKKLSDDNGYFDTDIASSLQAKFMKAVENAWSGISFSDRADFNGDTVKKIKKFEEEIKMAGKTYREANFDAFKPKISKVIFNNPATIVMWSDGTKTVVKCGENDDFDPEKGIAMACMKKLLGTNKTGSNYLDGVKNYISKWEEDNPEENVWTKLFGVIGTMTGENLVNTDAMDIPEEAEDQKPTEGGESNE